MKFLLQKIFKGKIPNFPSFTNTSPEPIKIFPFSSVRQYIAYYNTFFTFFELILINNSAFPFQGADTWEWCAAEENAEDSTRKTGTSCNRPILRANEQTRWTLGKRFNAPISRRMLHFANCDKWIRTNST